MISNYFKYLNLVITYIVREHIIIMVLIFAKSGSCQ